MTRALVLSGEGARGAFQAGVLSKLSTSGFDAVYGTSSGALNATLFSFLDSAGLLAEWEAISGMASVFELNDPFFLRPGLYNNRPLRTLAATVVNTHTPALPVTVTVTDLDIGETLYVHQPASLPIVAGFSDSVARSATVPILVCDLDHPNLVDGGVLVDLPLQQALADGHTDITLVLASPFDPGYSAPYKTVDGLGTLVNVGMRSFDLVLSAGTWNIIANLASLCSSLTIYAPKAEDDLGSPLDFSPAMIKSTVLKGQSCMPVDGLDVLQHLKFPSMD